MTVSADTQIADLTVDDHACLLLDAVRALPASRAAILRCRPQSAARFTLLGADDIPRVSVVSVHGQ